MLVHRERHLLHLTATSPAPGARLRRLARS
jgi:hypothetical protein